MQEKRKSLKKLTIERLSSLESNQSPESKVRFSVSFAEEEQGTRDYNEDNMLLSVKHAFDELRTPTFNTYTNFDPELFQKSVDLMTESTDEWVTESEQIKKVKILKCVNTTKIKNFYQDSAKVNSLECASFTQDDSNNRRLCSRKEAVCGCLII